jgi:hypothetical protein
MLVRRRRRRRRHHHQHRQRRRRLGFNSDVFHRLPRLSGVFNQRPRQYNHERQP